MKKILTIALVAGLMPIVSVTPAHAKVCGYTMTSRTNHHTGHTTIRNVYRCSK